MDIPWHEFVNDGGVMFNSTSAHQRRKQWSQTNQRSLKRTQTIGYREVKIIGYLFLSFFENCDILNEC
jgi:hypothetical protein